MTNLSHERIHLNNCHGCVSTVRNIVLFGIVAFATPIVSAYRSSIVQLAQTGLHPNRIRTNTFTRNEPRPPAWHSKTLLLSSDVNDIFTPTASGEAGDVTTELWLDLRTMSLSPELALSYIRDNVDVDTDVNATPITVVLVSEASSNVEGSQIVRFEANSKRLLTNNGDEEPDALGSVFTMEGDPAVDTIAAIDCVTAGNWAVIDYLDRDGDRTQAVSSLMDFVSFSIQPASLPLPSVGVGVSVTESAEVGGVALVCHTKEELFHAGTLFFNRAASASEVLSDGGILIAVPDNGDGDVKKPLMKTAVVLPLDLSLWTTALEIFG